MLHGPDISEIQAQALELLMFMDDVQKYKDSDRDRLERLKLALFTRQEYIPEKLFPERFQAQNNETVEGDEEDVEWDYTDIEWKSPKDMEEDKEQLNKIMGLLQQGAGRMDIGQAEMRRDGGWV